MYSFHMMDFVMPYRHAHAASCWCIYVCTFMWRHGYIFAYACYIYTHTHLHMCVCRCVYSSTRTQIGAGARNHAYLFTSSVGGPQLWSERGDTKSEEVDEHCWYEYQYEHMQYRSPHKDHMIGKLSLRVVMMPCDDSDEAEAETRIIHVYTHVCVYICTYVYSCMHACTWLIDIADQPREY